MSHRYPYIAPSSPTIADTGFPAYQQIIELFSRHGLPEPPVSLCDELSIMLLWARYGETVWEMQQ